MAKPNQQLAEAIDHFASQPDVDNLQADRLRAALASDRELLDSMNEAAKAGRVKGFALQNDGRNPGGHYDLQAGIVTLPAADFPREGGSDKALAATLMLQDMIVRFGNDTHSYGAGHQVRVSSEMLNNLQDTINGSPELARQMKGAVSAEPKSLLRKLTALDPGYGAGAVYDGDDKAILIPLNRLEQTSNPDSFNKNAMTFTLAHETQHAFNHKDKRDAYKAFDSEVRSIARDNNPINDYTVPISRLIAAGRVDEAKAEISGWNAVVSMVKADNPSADLNDMGKVQGARTHLFVDKVPGTKIFTARPDIAFNNNLSLDLSPENVEALGKLYFDRPPAGTPGMNARQVSTLGPHREADYANYYGKNAIERVVYFDRKHAHSVDGVEPQMQINMAQLRLDERLIERLGLEIDPHPEKRQPYYDTSQSPPTLRHFDHTSEGPSLNQHVPIDPALLVEEPMGRERVQPTPAQPGHPDHTLYSQIVAQVKEQDRVNSRSWDQVSERLSASLLSLAKENGITRVDHVVFSQKTEQVAAGENVFIVQGQLNDPAHVRAHMKTEAAVQTPEAVSFQKVEAINERAAQQVPALQAQQIQEEPSRGFGR